MIAEATKLQQAFIEVMSTLADKEQDVIVRRIGLSRNRETLQEIGNEYRITRERVRQIEDVGIKKIGRIVKTTPLAFIQDMADQIVALHAGVITRDRLVSALAEEISIQGQFNMGIFDVLIQANFNLLKSKPQLGTATYFHTPAVGKKIIEAVHKEAVKLLKKRGDILENISLYDAIRTTLLPQYGKIENTMIDSILDIYTDIVKGEEKYIGLEEWKILNPATLKDKAIYVLRKCKEPMHFIEISNHITEHFKESVKVSTIHNELIRNGEFVLIGRGIYVLAEWGYKEGTVLDVMIDIFTKAKMPLSTEELTARVLKVRQVKTTTIYMNLQNKNIIERVGRNMYQLKTK